MSTIRSEMIISTKGDFVYIDAKYIKFFKMSSMDFWYTGNAGEDITKINFPCIYWSKT